MCVSHEPYLLDSTKHSYVDDDDNDDDPIDSATEVCTVLLIVTTFIYTGPVGPLSGVSKRRRRHHAYDCT